MPPIVDAATRLRDARRDVRRAPRGVGRLARDPGLLASWSTPLVDLDEAPADDLPASSLAYLPPARLRRGAREGRDPGRARVASASACRRPSPRRGDRSRRVERAPGGRRRTCRDERSSGCHRLERDVGQPVDVAAVADRRDGDDVRSCEDRGPPPGATAPAKVALSASPEARVRDSSVARRSRLRRPRGGGSESAATARHTPRRGTSKPFTGMRRPSARRTTSVYVQAEPRARVCARRRPPGDRLDVGAVRDALEWIVGAPSRALARADRCSARSPRTLGERPARRVLDGTGRSETAMSDPCRLTDQREPVGRAESAPIGPFGATQCACTRSICAPGGRSPGLRGAPTPRTTGCQRRRAAP